MIPWKAMRRRCQLQIGETRCRITDFAILYWNEDMNVNVHGDDETDEVFLFEAAS
jgi:hypothetical protein